MNRPIEITFCCCAACFAWIYIKFMAIDIEAALSPPPSSIKPPFFPLFFGSKQLKTRKMNTDKNWLNIIETANNIGKKAKTKHSPNRTENEKQIKMLKQIIENSMNSSSWNINSNIVAWVLCVLSLCFDQFLFIRSQSYWAGKCVCVSVCEFFLFFFPVSRVVSFCFGQHSTKNPNYFATLSSSSSSCVCFFFLSRTNEKHIGRALIQLEIFSRLWKFLRIATAIAIERN